LGSVEFFASRTGSADRHHEDRGRNIPTGIASLSPGLPRPAFRPADVVRRTGFRSPKCYCAQRRGYPGNVDAWNSITLKVFQRALPDQSTCIVRWCCNPFHGCGSAWRPTQGSRALRKPGVRTNRGKLLHHERHHTILPHAATVGQNSRPHRLFH